MAETGKEPKGGLGSLQVHEPAPRPRQTPPGAFSRLRKIGSGNAPASPESYRAFHFQPIVSQLYILHAAEPTMSTASPSTATHWPMACLADVGGCPPAATALTFRSAGASAGDGRGSGG
jgi:hypothetical protein